MDLLKKKNWFVYLILSVATFGLINIFIVEKLGLSSPDAWYKKKTYWIVGTLALIFPVFIMLFILTLQSICKVAYSLRVSGDTLYYYPYFWIICLMVPIVGWILFVVMFIYVFVWTNINILKGNGEDLK